MNTTVSRRFSAIQGAATAYMESVTADLALYRDSVGKAKDEADKYKEPIASDFLTEKTANAKAVTKGSIARAQETYKNIVTENIGFLRDSLSEHLQMGVNPALASMLNTYQTFHIQPTKTETQGLIKMSGGSSLAYSAINAVLANTGADFRVNAPTAKIYEADLALLEKMADPPVWCDNSDLHALAEVMGLVDNMQRVMALTVSNEFKSRVSRLSDMSERWTSTVVPTLENLADYEPYLDANGKEVSRQEQLVADIESTTEAAQIVRDSDAGVKAAREVGRARARENERAQEAIGHYMK